MTDIKLEWDIRRHGWKLMPYAVDFVLEAIQRSRKPVMLRTIEGDADFCIYEECGKYRVIVQ